jgi:hypothetical protein
MSSNKKSTKPSDAKPKSDKVSEASEKRELEFEITDEELDKASGGRRAASIISRMC